jgi:hypothetical protein
MFLQLKMIVDCFNYGVTIYLKYVLAEMINTEYF